MAKTKAEAKTEAESGIQELWDLEVTKDEGKTVKSGISRQLTHSPPPEAST